MSDASTEPFRPPFARHYPRHEALDALVAAFVRGNYAAVRAGAEPLAESTDDPAVARAARDLRARLEPDPLARLLLVGTGVLLLFLVVWFYTHRLPR